MDFAPALRIAADHGDQGWLVIEAERGLAWRQPCRYQSMGLAVLNAMAREAGLDRKPMPQTA